MALSSSALSAIIKTALDTKFGVQAHTHGDADRQDFCDALATSIITYTIASTTVITPMGPGLIT